MTEEIKLIREAIELQKKQLDGDYDYLKYLFERLERAIEKYYDSNVGRS